MALNDASKLGTVLGGTINELSNTKQNLTSSDSTNQFNLQFSEGLKINESLVISKKTYATDSFILDHPIQCYLNSNIYKLDSGYNMTTTQPVFPFIFSATFIDTGVIIETLYTYSG